MIDYDVTTRIPGRLMPAFKDAALKLNTDEQIRGGAAGWLAYAAAGPDNLPSDELIEAFTLIVEGLADGVEDWYPDVEVTFTSEQSQHESTVTLHQFDGDDDAAIEEAIVAFLGSTYAPYHYDVEVRR